MIDCETETSSTCIRSKTNFSNTLWPNADQSVTENEAGTIVAIGAARWLSSPSESVRTYDEIKIRQLHVRGALTNGVTTDEIMETLLHATVYCGIPAGLDAFKAAHSVLVAEGVVPPPAE